MAGNGGKRPGAGRPRGPTPKTIEKAEAAAARVERAKALGKKLAIDVLEDFMHLFAGMAAMYQPPPPGVVLPPGRTPDDDKFRIYGKLACEQAAELAQYQTPRIAAIKHYLPPVPEDQVRPGDDAKVIEMVQGDVTKMDDPPVLGRVYKMLMARPKV